MAIGLKAVFEPVIDDRKADKEIRDLEKEMKSVEEIEPDLDTRSMQNALGDLDMPSMDSGAISDISTVSGGGGGVAGGAAGGGLTGDAAAVGVGRSTASKSGFLSSLGSGTAGAAMTVALGGAVAIGMLKGIETVASASPAWEKTSGLFGKAMNLFFRPFGNALADLIRPAMRGLLSMSKGWNEFWSTSGDNTAGTFGGGATGALAGGIAGAKGGAMLGAAAGSVIPGAGTAAGGLVGGIAGAIVGAVAGAGIGAMVGSKIQDLLEQSELPSLVDSVIPESITWGDYITFLSWGNFMNPLAWSAFVVDLQWDGWVPTLTWEEWVVDLEWDGWVTELSWGSWVSGLSWGSWVTGLSWNTWVSGLSWGSWVSGLKWNTWVNSLYWNSWVDNLYWSSWLDSLNWGTWVDDITWWRHIDDVTWSDFIDDLNWGKWIDSFSVPGFATGGIVRENSIVEVAEDEPEAIIPLSKLRQVGGTKKTEVTVNMQGSQESRDVTVDPSIDTTSLEDKLDAVIRAIETLGGDVAVEIDGQTLVKQSRKADSRYVDARSVNR